MKTTNEMLEGDLITTVDEPLQLLVEIERGQYVHTLHFYGYRHCFGCHVHWSVDKDNFYEDCQPDKWGHTTIVRGEETLLFTQ
jgi:hypothetical protein